jgi:nitronate monooxygenase
LKRPIIIQGGMGAGVSHWRLARTVSRLGQLGVVSGTALEVILARRLQDGDPGGHMHRALRRFPSPGIAADILQRYFRPNGRKSGEPYRNVPMFTLDPHPDLLGLTVAANFVEVNLAKEGHAGLVGINYLEKIQMHNLACLYGAMLAGVDYVLMGAGIPRAIPGILDRLALHKDVAMIAHVDGAGPGDRYEVIFEPRKMLPIVARPLKRPDFLAIVASNALATILLKKSNGRVDGFVIEGPTAGGHNAPPREKGNLNQRGEPKYGARDEVDLKGFRKLGLPFWMAGSYGDATKLKESLEQGAAGIQVGTAFAYTRESGLSQEIRTRVIRKALTGEMDVFTDPLASPTGFPFKVVSLEGTNSEKGCYDARPRACNLGYLRVPYKAADGTIGYRCSGDSVERYVRCGGRLEDTVGRKCLCNGLMANIGIPQIGPNHYVEKPLVTSGDDARNIARFLKPGELTYSSADVIRNLLGLVKNVRVLSSQMASA